MSLFSLAAAQEQDRPRVPGEHSGDPSQQGPIPIPPPEVSSHQEISQRVRPRPPRQRREGRGLGVAGGRRRPPPGGREGQLRRDLDLYPTTTPPNDLEIRRATFSSPTGLLHAGLTSFCFLSRAESQSSARPSYPFEDESISDPRVMKTAFQTDTGRVTTPESSDSKNQLFIQLTKQQEQKKAAVASAPRPSFSLNLSPPKPAPKPKPSPKPKPQT